MLLESISPGKLNAQIQNYIYFDFYVKGSLYLKIESSIQWLEML